MLILCLNSYNVKEKKVKYTRLILSIGTLKLRTEPDEPVPDENKEHYERHHENPFVESHGRREVRPFKEGDTHYCVPSPPPQSSPVRDCVAIGERSFKTVMSAPYRGTG